MRVPSDSQELLSLLDVCHQNGRVCPTPDRWNKLYDLLPETRRVGNGWEPALPLILGAWHHSSDLVKALRLEEHVRWADQHGALDKVAGFLRELGENEWHHLDE